MKLEILAAIEILEKYMTKLDQVEDRLQVAYALKTILVNVNKLEEK